MKILTSSILAVALALGASTAAQARDHHGDRGYSSRGYYDARYDRRADYRYDRRYDDRRYGYDQRRYDDRRYGYDNRRYERRSYCYNDNNRVRDRNQAAIAGALIGGVIGSQTGNGYDQGSRALLLILDNERRNHGGLWGPLFLLNWGPFV